MWSVQEMCPHRGVQPRQAASAGHMVPAGRSLGRTQLMASAWPSHGLALCSGNHSSVTPAALQSDGWRMCSSLPDAKTLTPPREAERESPVPPKRLCLGTAVPEPQAGSLSSRAIRDKRRPLRRHSPAPGEPLHGISTALLSPFPLTTQSQHLQPLLQECQDGGTSLLPSAPGGGGSAVTGCAGAAEEPPTLLPQELLSLPAPAGRRLAPPSRSRAGPDGNLAPCAAARESTTSSPQPRAGLCPGPAPATPARSTEQGPLLVSPAP